MRLNENRVILASAQSTRGRLSRIMFPSYESTQVDGGDESHTHHLGQIAERKTRHAIKLLENEAARYGHHLDSETGLLLRAIMHGDSVVVGADTNNALGSKTSEHLLKPEDTQSLEQILFEIGSRGYYLVRSGTAIVNGIARVGTAQVLVQLEEVAQKALLSPEGRKVYIAKMAEMFGEQFFTKVSGGIAFEVFMALGWVKKINGVEVGAAGSDEAVKLLAIIARSGFVAEVIAQYSKEAAFRLHHNPIVDEIVSDARDQQAPRPQ